MPAAARAALRARLHNGGSSASQEPPAQWEPASLGVAGSLPKDAAEVSPPQSQLQPQSQHSSDCGMGGESGEGACDASLEREPPHGQQTGVQSSTTPQPPRSGVWAVPSTQAGAVEIAPCTQAGAEVAPCTQAGAEVAPCTQAGAEWLPGGEGVHDESGMAYATGLEEQSLPLPVLHTQFPQTQAPLTQAPCTCGATHSEGQQSKRARNGGAADCSQPKQGGDDRADSALTPPQYTTCLRCHGDCGDVHATLARPLNFTKRGEEASDVLGLWDLDVTELFRDDPNRLVRS
jgi:hypothetical protein